MRYKPQIYPLFFMFLAFTAPGFYFALHDNEGAAYIVGGLSHLCLAGVTVLLALGFIKDRVFCLPPFRVERDTRPFVFWAIMSFFFALCFSELLIGLSSLFIYAPGSSPG